MVWWNRDSRSRGISLEYFGSSEDPTSTETKSKGRFFGCVVRNGTDERIPCNYGVSQTGWGSKRPLLILGGTELKIQGRTSDQSLAFSQGPVPVWSR